MKKVIWPKLTVRRRIIISNFIMVFVPVFLLIAFCLLVFTGLRATGSFRDRELELFWPEAGSSAALQLGLSHLRAHVDWKWRINKENNALPRHCASMEKMGVKIAVIDDDIPVYETEPGNAWSLLQKTYEIAPQGGNVFLWNDDGLVYRYMSQEQHSVAVAVGKIPFKVGSSYFPDSIEVILRNFGIVLAILAGVIIILVGIMLSRYLSRQILVPLTELQKSAKRIEAGDYATKVMVYNKDELGDTAAIFDEMRQKLCHERKLHEVYEHNRRELLAGIAHDLATPLTKIQGYTSGVLDGVANTTAKKRHYLELVLRTSQNMERLIQQLFLFSKLELNKVVFNLEKTDLANIINEFVTAQTDILQENKFWLRHDIAADLLNNTPVLLDKVQFQRVLENILSNSIKYKNGDIGSLSISLTVLTDVYRLILTDSGCGVAKDDLERIFESFYRTDKARSETTKGSGLGLAVSRKIIENMQGHIYAKTAETGLSIYIELPIAK